MDPLQQQLLTIPGLIKLIDNRIATNMDRARDIRKEKKVSHDNLTVI